MDWQHYNVHWKFGTQKGKTCLTALDKQDARTTFERISHVDMENGYRIPFEAEVTKVIGPLGMRQRTGKQKITSYYRSCIGAAMMLDKALNNIAEMPLYTEEAQENKMKILNALGLALKQTSKVKRDVRDLFTLMGIKIK